MTTSTTSLSTTISGLTSGTQYTFTVAAQNLRGFSVESAPSSATTICVCAATNACCDGCFPLNLGGTCTDGRFCTVSDTCAANGTCQSGSPRDCTGVVTVNSCQTPSCNTVSDSCVAQAKPDNTACNDSNLCTTVDVCVAGACTGTMPVTCPETACRNVGSCVQATGLCTATNKADGLLCTPTTPNTEGQCATGACQFSSCVAGYGDCSPTAPGCESNLATDVNSCGTCGNACRTGNRFLHARTRCASSSCVFLGCDPGWQDTDNDCTTGAESCNTGCEACRPLGDGSFDIPDDTVDNDCAGGDSTNTDTLGWYVDSSFTPAGTTACAGSVARGTRGCPFTSLYDVTFAASQQSWLPPGPTRRYIYIAEGTYSDVGTVFEATLPLVYAGGYRRTMSGPWTRDGAASIIASTTAGTSVVAQKLTPPTGTWAALDKLTLSKTLQVGGNFVVRLISSPTTGSGVTITPTTNSAMIGRIESSTTGSIGDSSMLHTNRNWSVVDSTIFGNINYGADFTIQSSTVNGGGPTTDGSLMSVSIPSIGAPRVTVRDSIIAGALFPSAYGLVADSQFGSRVYLAGDTTKRSLVLRSSFAREFTLYWGDVRDSAIGPGVQLSVTTSDHNTFAAGPTINIDRTTILRSIIAPRVRGSELQATNTLFLNGVAFSFGNNPSLLTGNIFAATSANTAMLDLYDSTSGKGPGARIAILNNIFIYGSGLLGAAGYGVREGTVASDPDLVLNNAFVGFAPANIYFDEGTTPLADVGRLNTLSQLSACARGGNLSFADNAAAGLLSSDPASPLVGRITTGPLIDAARSLPYTCDAWTIAASTTDITGSNARVCRTAQDIGAYEVCP